MIQKFGIDKFILSKKHTFSDFFDLIKNKTKFSGYAYHENHSYRYNLFFIDNQIYASQDLKQSSDKYEFQYFFEISPEYLEDSSFKYGTNSNHFNFEADILVEIQFYNHQNEQKIIFRQQDKVDLIFSLHLHVNDENIFNYLEVNQYASLEKAVKWHQMMKKLDSRCETILKK